MLEKKYSTIALLLIAVLAFYVGWLSQKRVHGQVLAKHIERPSEYFETLSTEVEQVNEVWDELSKETETGFNPINVDLLAAFKQSLRLEDYAQAMAEYQMVARTVSSDQHRVEAGNLKIILLQHLDLLLETSAYYQFAELSEHYLSIYYDDIDVLLRLGAFNQATASYAEAVAVYQLAKTYAYTNKNVLQVDQAINDFISQTDAQLRSTESLPRLTIIYELMNKYNLLQPHHQLMQAKVYMTLGEWTSAETILTELLADDLSSSIAQRLLSAIYQTSSTNNNNNNNNSIAIENTYNEQIVLKKQRNQFLVKVGINGKDATLMIDTGASMTTLSQDTFEKMSDKHRFTLQGPRMFTTANGVVKGTVYRADNFSLGRFELKDVQIAVLDFEMTEGLNGLLGMNILSNFRFYIEQNKALIYLSKRL